MSLRSYLTSKIFFGQALAAVTIICVSTYLFMFWLTFTTNHGEEIVVPNLSKLTEEQAEDALDDLDLDYVMLDSVDYNKNYPKYTVVEQDPLPGAKVKKNRKIYFKINSSGFKMVIIPNLIEKTYRQAGPTLKSLGLEEGSISYVPYLGKDMVLEMKCNGKKLSPGDKVLKSSKIDLVLGDGKVGYEEADEDTLQSTETPIDTPAETPKTDE
jgi:eukaryotic-like serine/threonine-protein kinase